MKRYLPQRCHSPFSLALALAVSFHISPAHSASINAGEGFIVVKSGNASFEVDKYESSTMGPLSDWRLPFARVTPSYSKQTLSDSKSTYEVLLDNGRGRSSRGYVDEKDVAFFKDQVHAEVYASTLEPKQAGVQLFAKNPASSGSGHANSSVSSSFVPATVPTAQPESTHGASSNLKQIETFREAKDYLEQIQTKLKTELGTQFANKAKENWKPTTQDRIKYLEAIEKVLTPQERAFFTMTSTAFAEDRNSAKDPKNREDLEGRASMAFTMNIIENRADSKFSRQFMDDKYLDASDLEKVGGVVAADRQFSSWNAGSTNFGNTIRTMLGLGEEETVARDRALAAYRDYSSGDVHLMGFDADGDGATMMLNQGEVSGIRTYMRKDVPYRRKNPNTIVSWTVESIMHNGRYKAGVHQVALRIPKYSISVPKSEGSKELVKVVPENMGHWPVYLANVHSKNMETARMSQEGR